MFNGNKSPDLELIDTCICSCWCCLAIWRAGVRYPHRITSLPYALKTEFKLQGNHLNRAKRERQLDFASGPLPDHPTTRNLQTSRF
jgi:hypothetical protein